MPPKYFENHEAFWQAVKKTRQMKSWADEVQSKHPKNPNIKYDHRNLYTLGLLIFDLSDIPEDQQEQYFKSEYEKLYAAFNISDPNNPKRSISENVKPYIKRMFENVMTDYKGIDFNNPQHIQKVLHNSLATQMLATMVEDYPTESMELYPTHQDMTKIDAIASKAYAKQLEVCYSISEEGLNQIGDYFITFGQHKQLSTSRLLQAELIHTVFDTTLKGSDRVMLDPLATDLSAKFFMKKPFTVINDLGDGPEPFTDGDYARYYAEHLADTCMNTSFECQIFTAAMAHSSTMEKRDVLLINGKPLEQLVQEYATKGYDWKEKFIEPGRFLREALLKGDPVTLVSSTVSKDGKIAFHNKDIRLDLDKMNKMDRESRNPIRKWLDRMGWWPIPPKYPTNEARDAKLSVILADPNSEHQKQVKAIEEEYIRSYNSIDPAKRGGKGCASVIPQLIREEVKTTDLSLDADIDKSKSVDRMRMKIDDPIKEEVVETESKIEDPPQTVVVDPMKK